VWCWLDYGGESFLLFSKLESGRFPSHEFIQAAVAQFLADGTVKTADGAQAQQETEGTKCVTQ
jgi:hypothetical protein